MVLGLKKIKELSVNMTHKDNFECVTNGIISIFVDRSGIILICQIESNRFSRHKTMICCQTRVRNQNVSFFFLLLLYTNVVFIRADNVIFVRWIF